MDGKIARAVQMAIIAEPGEVRGGKNDWRNTMDGRCMQRDD